ncbi:bone morphogenetic protein 5-like [Clarias gariepinus]|uniref:gonadal somatic cell derived factor n=1 Tax=Clarias gariepinus TaxID=13013 RepID=UPI00234DAE1F|nr:gonadal somatic cell derived factor [Clarias gariepinus]
MSLGLLVTLALVACHPGKASVLHPSPEEPTDAQSPPIVRVNRCLGDLHQKVRRAVLDSLNLQSEPRISVPGMVQIREQWKSAFKATRNSSPGEQDGNTPLPSSTSENSTQLQCCKLASQVFIKDLGWDEWIIYPESFTFVQCTACVPELNQRVFTCRDDDPATQDPPSPAPCCQVTSLDPVPFLYLDETSSLFLSSVPLPRECGCSHDDGDPRALQP